MIYLGYLQRHDPLYDFLHYEIRPQIGLRGSGDYRVFKTNGSNNVYLYEDVKTLRRLIGKFYYNPCKCERSSAHNTMENEFHNLNFMRGQGFSGSGVHYIARPLGRNRDLNELLLEEGCYGESLSSVICRSIQNKVQGVLYGKLTALAYFLSRFHNHTAIPYPVDFSAVLRYGYGLADGLQNKGFISNHRRWRLEQLFECYRNRGEMYSDNQVMVHGDATPENFLFGDGLHVISFDLERMRRADRCFDVGRLCAELAHFFMLHTGNRLAAEPFIGHFLWEYSCHFPDRESAFHAIVKRIPFYMGINFLRIARNTYFDWNYRQQLLNAGVECLKGGLL